MTDYLLMVMEDENAHSAQSPKAMAELIDERAAFIDGLRRAGHLRDSGRFRPSKEGKRVRRDSAGLHVQGGPFAEDGKALGAYYWMNARNVEEAAALAQKCPTLPADDVDVRPLMKGHLVNDKEAK